MFRTRVSSSTVCAAALGLVRLTHMTRTSAVLLATAQWRAGAGWRDREVAAMPRLPFSWTQRRDVVLLLDEEDDGDERAALDPAVGDDDADERTFVALGGGSWERRLTRREKMVRAGSVVAVVLVVALALIGGPGAVLASLGNAARALNPAPVAQAAAPPVSNVLDVPVPANTAQNPQVSLRPVNGPETLAYACWVDEPASAYGERAATLHVAVYAVASHNWTLLTSPVAQSAGCTVITDMTAPARVVLALSRLVGAGGPCRLPDLYRSEDRGAHWAPAPWPDGTLAPCDAQFVMEGGRLYAERDASPSGQPFWLSVTADGGASWAAADGGLAGLTDVALVALRPGGRLLAEGIDPRRRGSTTLWQSDDAGAHWRFLLTVPGSRPRVYASSDPEATANGGWGRLYAYAGQATASSGSSLGGLTGFGENGANATLETAFAEPAWMVSRLQPNGAATPAWSPVALEPDAASTDQRPAGAWLRDAGEAPGGGMLFTQPDGSGNVTNIVAPFDLVAWNGRVWRLLPQVIPANTTLQGISWNHGVMRLWTTHKSSILRPIELFTYAIAPGDLR
jgi:hypothetical protein